MTFSAYGRMLRGLIAVIAIATAAPVMAGGPAAYLDLMFVPSASLDYAAEYDGDRVTFDDDDTGYGVRGAVMLTSRLFASGEFTSNEYSGRIGALISAVPDAVELPGTLTFEMVRMGLGGILVDGPLQAFVSAEWIRANLDIEVAGFGAEASDNGYGVHLGLRGFAGPVALTLQAGYVDVGDGDGLEWSAELVYSLNRWLGVFAGYRSTDLEFADGPDDRERYQLGDVRVGVTVYLNR